MVTSNLLESSATVAKRLETSVDVYTSEGTVRNALYGSGLVTVKNGGLISIRGKTPRSDSSLPKVISTGQLSSGERSSSQMR
jgi:hypothetical protein